MYEFILKNKVFTVHSDNPSLKEINSKIYNILIHNKQYVVQSQVNEIIFQSFIDNFLNESIPNINFDNLQEYEMLCKEFEYKESIILLFKKQPIYAKYQKLKNSLNDAFYKHDKIIKEYQKIIFILFKDNDIDSFIDFIEIKNELFEACKYHKLNMVKLLTCKKILHKNGLTFALNKKTKTAGVFRNIYAKGDVLIPRSVKYKNQKYIVTAIHEKSFQKSKIKSVIFDKKSQLKVIEENAFYESFIETIIIPPHVSKIGQNAFAYCQNLRSVLFTEHSEIKSIDKYAFSNSSILENISIPSCVRELKEGWFYDSHDKLKITIIPTKNRLISYYDDAFIIGKYENLNAILFARRNIKVVSIPSFIQIIAPYAFYKCTKLTKIAFSKNSSLIRICKYAFSYTSVNKIKIPSGVKEINDYAFFHCHNLKKIDFKKDSQLKAIGQCVIAFSSIKDFAIPSNVSKFDDLWIKYSPNNFKIKILPNQIFNILLYENYLLLEKSNILNNNFDVLLFVQRNIESVAIPSFIEKISSCAFKNCLKLKNVEFLPNSKLLSIESEAFSNSILEQIIIPSHTKMIGNSAFYNCKQLKQIDFEKESELKSIGKLAFALSSLERISIPPSVTTIDQLAFQKCEQLKVLDFSENSKSIMIDSSAFNETFIESITFSPQITDILLFVFNYIKPIQYAQFETCSSSNMILIKIFPISIKTKWEKYKKQWFSMKSFVNQVKKHLSANSCITLIDNKFIVEKTNPKSNNFDILVSVNPDYDEFTIPSCIKRIDFIYFFYNVNFKQINFPNDSKLLKIDKNTFQYSTIEKITIPSHVTEICNQAFNYCKNLTKIVFPNDSKLERIDKYAFENSSLISAYFPKSVSEICDYAFDCCKNLKNIFFTENSKLKRIGSYAFSNTAIENIQIPKNVTTIGYGCFHFCLNLKTIEIMGSNIEIKKDCFHKQMIMISFPNALKITFAKFEFSNNFSLFVSSQCLFIQVD